MASPATTLDLSALPIAARREVRDFYQFLLARRAKSRQTSTPPVTRHFSDLCGELSWKGDAVAAQRKLRDEW
jgi:hypothetical protein